MRNSFVDISRSVAIGSNPGDPIPVAFWGDLQALGRVRNNRFIGNDTAIWLSFYPGTGPPADFGTADDPGNNVFRCNSGVTGMGADIWVIGDSTAPASNWSGVVSMVGNSWDHAPPTINANDPAADGSDIVLRDGPGLSFDLTNSTVATPDCPSNHAPGGPDTDAADGGAPESDVARDAAFDAPDDGPGSICPPPPVCTGDLGNLGTREFSIVFRITTTSTVTSGILSQREICQGSSFWEIRLFDAGHLLIEFDASGISDYEALLSTLTVNDGASHEVRICRRLAQLYAFIDGEPAGSRPFNESIGQLVPLVTGTSVCAADVDGTVPLAGTISDVCVGSL